MKEGNNLTVPKEVIDSIIVRHPDGSPVYDTAHKISHWLKHERIFSFHDETRRVRFTLDEARNLYNISIYQP